MYRLTSNKSDNDIETNACCACSSSAAVAVTVVCRAYSSTCAINILDSQSNHSPAYMAIANGTASTTFLWKPAKQVVVSNDSLAWPVFHLHSMLQEWIIACIANCAD